MPYSDDLRQKLLHAVDTGTHSQAALARLFGVSLSYLKNVVRRRDQTGHTRALPHAGGRQAALTSEQREAVRQHVAAHPAALLRELALWLGDTHGVTLSLSAVSRLLRRLGLPRKKEPGTPRSATRRPTWRSAANGATR